MSASFLRAAHTFLKGWQDRLSRSRLDHPGCQLAQILARARQLGIPSGPCVDVGGGNSPYRSLLQDSSERLVEVDRVGGSQVNVIGDAHRLPFQSSVAGLVILAEVLEHLPEPQIALEECYRVLQPGGMLSITAPQYWHVHGYPSDYYRFTDAGLRYLCEKAGFTIVDCWSRGGPVLILFHTIRVNLSERWRPLFVLPFYAVAEWLDRLTYTHWPEGRHYDALGWSVLAHKPASTPSSRIQGHAFRGAAA